MQNTKMSNPTDGINESNKKLRSIYEQLCCLTDAVNDVDINVGDIELEVDGVEELLQDILNALSTSGGAYNTVESSSLATAASLTFNPGDVHSFTWELGIGATVQIATGTSTNTFESNGSISFSTLNTQTLIITAVGGTVKIIYIH